MRRSRLDRIEYGFNDELQKLAILQAIPALVGSVAGVGARALSGIGSLAANAVRGVSAGISNMFNSKSGAGGGQNPPPPGQVQPTTQPPAPPPGQQAS